MTQPPAPLLMASALGLAIVVSSTPASAAKGLVVPQPEAAVAPAAPSAPASWSDFNARRLTLPEGTFELHGDFVSNVSTSNGGKPIWLTPNMAYGIADGLTLQIATNPQAEFLPIAGGLCLGTSKYCGHLFNLVSANAIFSLVRAAEAEIAPHIGIDYTLSPSTVWARAGALLKLVLPASLAVTGDPTVVVAVTKRSSYADAQALEVPLRLGYQAAELLNVGLVSGVNGPLTKRFSSSYSVPVGLGLWFAANPSLDLGANLTFVNVASKAGWADGRTVALTANYRL